MPILHFQINARRRTPEGAVVPVSPTSALHEQGPLVRVSITLEENFAQTVVQSGLQLPGPVVGWGLIDTGVSHTCIDEAAARRMGLPVIDVVGIASASEAEVQRNVYPVQVEVVGFPIDCKRHEPSARNSKGRTTSPFSAGTCSNSVRSSTMDRPARSRFPLRDLG